MAAFFAVAMRIPAVAWHSGLAPLRREDRREKRGTRPVAGQPEAGVGSKLRPGVRYERMTIGETISFSEEGFRRLPERTRAAGRDAGQPLRIG